jgi:hypothetical protein
LSGSQSRAKRAEQKQRSGGVKSNHEQKSSYVAIPSTSAGPGYCPWIP